jgi:xylulokinase
VVTVGIDIGTTSVKALAVDAAGRVVGRARLVHGVEVPGPGRLQHDAGRAWCDAPARALATVVAALPDPAAVVAVAVAAMAPSLAAVDAGGRPLGPGVLYGDERARDGGTVEDTDPLRSAETVGLLRWAASAHPDAAGYWPAQAVANRSLGGPGAVDLTTAFAAGVLFGGSGWDAQRCGALGVDPATLPAVELFGQPIGEVATGTPGATLVAGGVDAFCEQLVVGPLEPGDVLVVCGSTLVVWVVAEGSPRVDGLWTMPDLTPGRSLVGGPSNAGGLFLDWVDRVLRPVGADDPAADPNRVPVWQPFLRGERVPLHDPGRRATLAGLDLTQGPSSLRRGAFEASAMALRHIVERAGGAPSRIVATGGGSRVASWMQAIADVTAVPVQPVAVPEGGALGAAWLARMGAGLEDSTDGAVRWAGAGAVVDPDPVWVGPAGDRYRRYLDALGPGGVAAGSGTTGAEREGWGP